MILKARNWHRNTGSLPYISAVYAMFCDHFLYHPLCSILICSAFLLMKILLVTRSLTLPMYTVFICSPPAQGHLCWNMFYFWPVTITSVIPKYSNPLIQEKKTSESGRSCGVGWCPSRTEDALWLPAHLPEPSCWFCTNHDFTASV